MIAKLGDIALAENRDKKKKSTYIVSHLAKNGSDFRGIQVVKNLHDGQSYSEIIKLPNGYYVILSKVDGGLKISDICTVIDSVGDEIGCNIDKLWQKFHAQEIKRFWKAARSCSGLFPEYNKVESAKITTVCSGGTCSGK